MEKPWFTYILECKNGSFYTGVTNDLEKRMQAHAKGKGSKYVRQKGFKKLLISRECQSRSEAQKLESHIKSLPRQEKLQYLRTSSNFH